MKTQQLIVIFLHYNYKACTCILHLDATIRCILRHVFAAVILTSAYPLKGGRRGLPELMAALPHAVTPALPPDLTTRPCEPNVNRFVFVVFGKRGRRPPLSRGAFQPASPVTFKDSPSALLSKYHLPEYHQGDSAQECVCACARLPFSHGCPSFLRATTFSSTPTAAS